jgi:hypothetical protein
MYSCSHTQDTPLIDRLILNSCLPHQNAHSLSSLDFMRFFFRFQKNLRQNLNSNFERDSHLRNEQTNPHILILVIHPLLYPFDVYTYTNLSAKHGVQFYCLGCMCKYLCIHICLLAPNSICTATYVMGCMVLYWFFVVCSILSLIISTSYGSSK